jgi:hypothetical protein
VWLSSYWFNECKQAGPSTTSISIVFGAASGMAA